MEKVAFSSKEVNLLPSVDKNPSKYSFLHSPYFHFILIFSLALYYIFNRITEAPLHSDGSLYAEVSRNIIETGNWLTLHYTTGEGLKVWMDKPPLFFWLTAISGRIFGFNTFSMKLVATLSGLIGIGIIYLLGRKLFGYWGGVLGSLVLLFTQQYLAFARKCSPYSLVCVLALISLFYFWSSVDMNSKKIKRGYFYLGITFSGLGVFNMTLFGLMPLIIFTTFLIFWRKEFKIQRDLWLKSAFLFLIIASPWYFYNLIVHKKLFIINYVGCHIIAPIINRGYVAAWSNMQYLKAMIEQYWPWLPFLLYGLYRIVKEYRKISEIEKMKLSFIIIWIFLPVLIALIMAYKRRQYIIQIYPASALLIGYLLGVKIKEVSRIRWLGAITITFLLAGITIGLFPLLPKYMDSYECRPVVRLLPIVKQIPPQVRIYTYKVYHPKYRNTCVFYGRRSIHGGITQEELLNKSARGEKLACFTTVEEFRKLIRVLPTLKIIGQSNSVVLFSNTSSP